MPALRLGMAPYHLVIFLIAISVRDVRADVVAVEGRPLAVDVKIVALREGELVYQLPAGREVSRPVEKIHYLQITGWELFNLAEKQQRDGYGRQSINTYEKVLSDLTAEIKNGPSPKKGDDQFDRLLLARCRLLRQYDTQGRFDRAVEMYLEVIERMPTSLESLRPMKLPAAGSTFLQAALDTIDGALARHGQDDIGRSLATWRRSWPLEQAGDKSAIEMPGTDVKESGQDKKTAETLRKIQSDVEAERYDEAIRASTEYRATRKGLATASGLQNAELFYWQGRALLGRSESANTADAKQDAIRAGLAFMRVVIHCPHHPLAAESLFRCAEICQRAGQTDRAAGLWSELVDNHPTAKPWTDRAREKLSQLKSPTSSPAP